MQTEFEDTGVDKIWGPVFLEFDVCLNFLKLLAEKAGFLATPMKILTE